DLRGPGGPPRRHQLGERLVRLHRLAADLAVAEPQLQITEERLVLQERLVPDAPRERGRGKEAPLVVRPEHARAVPAPADREEVLVGDVVVDAPEVGEERLLADVARRGNALRARAKVE